MSQNLNSCFLFLEPMVWETLVKMHCKSVIWASCLCFQRIKIIDKIFNKIMWWWYQKQNKHFWDQWWSRNRKWAAVRLHTAGFWNERQAIPSICEVTGVPNLPHREWKSASGLLIKIWDDRKLNNYLLLGAMACIELPMQGGQNQQT